MTRLKFLIAGLFAIALVTGVLVGMGVSRRAQYQDRREWMAEVLNLTPKQKADMEEIWSSDHTLRQSVSERSHKAQSEHDEAIQKLLTPEQKAAVARIDDDFKKEMLELNHERDEAFNAAVESTKKILTAEQREKYDEILKGGFRGNGRPGGPDGSWRGPSTRRGGTGGSGGPGGPPSTRPSPAPEGAAH